MKTSLEFRLSAATSKMEHSFVREILKITTGVPGIISLAGGLPNPRSFPTTQLAEIFSQVIREEGDQALQYGASEGDRVFKQVLKEFEEVPHLPDEEIMITVGSTNGIYLYTRSMIDPGDIIICEAPGYPGSIAAMEACGARLAGVEMDDLGLIPEQLRKILKSLHDQKETVKFIYLIPEFQNPSGRTMDLKRRRAILEVAREFSLPILEDQPYRELRFEGERIVTLWELARTEFGDPKLVTIAKSFSKILGPGLRLGFASGSPEIIGHMVKWAQKSTVSPDCLTQRVTARYIEKGYLKGQIQRIIDLYRPRRDAMLAALEKYMPPDVRWTRPMGGMFVWVTMNESCNTDDLLEKAIQQKVAFIPGNKFYPRGIDRYNEMRLNFSYPAIEQIEEGILRLSKLM